VFDKDGKSLLSFQEAIVTKPAKGSGYDVLVALMSEALGDLSKTIAENLRFIKNNLVIKKF